MIASGAFVAPEKAVAQERLFASSNRGDAEGARQQVQLHRLRDEAKTTFDMFFNPTYYLGGDEILGGMVYDAWKAKIDAKIEQAQQAAERGERMKRTKADIEARFAAFSTSMTAPAPVTPSPTALSPTKP